ncbi:MAG: nucleotidyltransferase family protein [Acidimicrobiales bacterium]
MTWDVPGAPVTFAPGPLPADLLSRCRIERLTGVLAAAVAAGDVEIDTEERRALARAHVEVMNEALLLDDMLLEAVEVLDAVGVDHRVLKGTALAHLVHLEPSRREYGDIDLLVRAELLDVAVTALVAAGAERKLPALSSDFDRRFAKSVTLGWRHGTELDLHRTIAPGPFGLLVDPTDLWDRPSVLPIAGRRLLTLPLELHLVHGAYHVALGGGAPRLGNLRDVRLLMVEPGVDLDQVRDWAARWRGESPLAAGVAAAAAVGGDAGPLADWVSGHVPGRREERLLAAYGPAAGRFGRQARASLRVLGWRDRSAYARALLVPRRANLEARGRGRWAQLWRARRRRGHAPPRG